MNAAVEMHDSKVAAVFQTAASVVVRLSPAYVHRSDGRPGFDPGEGWSQAVELVFTDGVIDSPLPELPCTLEDGHLSGGVEFAGIVPLPITVQAVVRFEARSLNGERLVVRGSGLAVVPVAEAVFVETFPGTSPVQPEAAPYRSGL